MSSPAIPRHKGRMVRKELQGYETPPQVTGMRKEVAEAMKRKDPK